MRKWALDRWPECTQVELQKELPKLKAEIRLAREAEEHRLEEDAGLVTLQNSWETYVFDPRLRSRHLSKSYLVCILNAQRNSSIWICHYFPSRIATLFCQHLHSHRQAYSSSIQFYMISNFLNTPFRVLGSLQKTLPEHVTGTWFTASRQWGASGVAKELMVIIQPSYPPPSLVDIALLAMTRQEFASQFVPAH